ncbi:MAG TPA: hypothetical protein VG368_00500 [Acidimicrobiales bacterium]|jgi:hypothetical protein|nr:hypothetical protein [Acidimicrobiales bacterium]
MSARRQRIALVAQAWGGEGDAASLTRLVAGALALHGDVDVLHLCEVAEVTVTRESVFIVHAIPLIGAHPVRAAIALAASEAGGHPDLPRSVVGLLERWEGSAPSVPQVLAGIAPDAVVLAGSSQPFDLECLRAPGDVGRPRVVFLPMTGRAGVPESDRFATLVDACDALISIHPGEDRALRARFAHRVAVEPLDVALPLNRSATSQGLFGVGWFGEYVLLLRRFPAEGGRYAHSVTHDVLRESLGEIAVAEVDGMKWRISDHLNTAELPVNPTRVNLWRLMANGLMTVDLRPPDILGREAIESMMLGTPVVVPDGSAAMEHAAAGNGGLWYRNLGEALDAARALRDDSLRAAFGNQGATYAKAHHGDTGAFVSRLGGLLGL